MVQLHTHIDLYRRYKFSWLNEFSNWRFSFKPFRNCNFHCQCYFLDLAQSFFVNNFLRILDIWAGTHCKNCTLIFCIFKYKLYYCIDISNCDVYFIVQIFFLIKYVIYFYTSLLCLFFNLLLFYILNQFLLLFKFYFFDWHFIHMVLIFWI